MLSTGFFDRIRESRAISCKEKKKMNQQANKQQLKGFARLRKASALFLALFLVIGLAACGQPAANGEKKADTGEKKYNVVATSTMLTDLAKIIGGDKVEVNGLMAAGVDPHLYQPTAGDVAKLQAADMVVINGLHLEGQMGEVFSKLTEANKLVAEVGESIPVEDRLPFADSIYDPHIWFSVPNWKLAARNVTDTYIKLSEKDKDYFEANYEKYIKELDELDSYIRSQVESLPESSRVLITAHDAFNYFGREYHFEVIGLQGISTESEAATSDVAELADYIVKNKIKAIFVESSVPKKNIEALQEAVKAKGFDVQIGGELYSDSLGVGEDGTYIGMFKANINTIVSALKD